MSKIDVTGISKTGMLETDGKIKENIPSRDYYRNEMLRKKRVRLLEILVLIVITLSPLLINNYYFTWLFTLGAIYSIYTLSWSVMKNFGGRTSLGHTIPFGLAGYFSAIGYLVGGDVSTLPLIWILSGILSAIILYIPARKLDRVAFVFITFIMGIIFWIASSSFVLERDGVLYGGEEGFSIAVTSQNFVYFASIFLLAGIFAMLSFLRLSTTGLRMVAVRDDEKAARAVGIDVNRFKFYYCLISCLIASIAGGMYVLLFSHINPEIFSVHVAIFPFIATLFFRNESELGNVAGSFILVIVSNYLNAIVPQLHLLLYAVLLITSPKILRWRFSDAEG
jgi:branched-chain amino acid transport system permease protein